MKGYERRGCDLEDSRTRKEKTGRSKGVDETVDASESGGFDEAKRRRWRKTGTMTGTDEGEGEGKQGRRDVDMERDTKNRKAFTAQRARESLRSRRSHRFVGGYEAVVAFYILWLSTKPGCGMYMQGTLRAK